MLSISSFAQNIEVQRKYEIGKLKELNGFLSSSDSIEGFKTFQHSNYTFYDLYFDTPDLKLLEQGYSLRMRKKIISQEETLYAFQLKSEMDNADGYRLEVEEPEIDFYMLMFEGKKISLAHLLDLLFAEMDKIEPDLTSLDSYLKCVRMWIAAKVDSPIAPFQKLKFIDEKVFTNEVISSLKPQIIGVSKRMRSHIYLRADEAKDVLGFELSLIRRGELPDFFINQPNRYWIIETSLDSSIFYPLFETTKPIHILTEFEMENKYNSDELGAKIMDKFEQLLKTQFGIRPLLPSKYKQSMSALKE